MRKRILRMTVQCSRRTEELLEEVQLDEQQRRVRGEGEEAARVLEHDPHEVVARCRAARARTAAQRAPLRLHVQEVASVGRTGSGGGLARGGHRTRLLPALHHQCVDHAAPTRAARRAHYVVDRHTLLRASQYSTVPLHTIQYMSTVQLNT